MTRYQEYYDYIVARRESVSGIGAIRYDAVGGGGVKSPVEISVEQLEKISMDFRSQIVEAVRRSWAVFGDLLDDRLRSYYEESEREIVRSALWLNLTKPQANRYEDFNKDTMPISRPQFYRYRRAFLEILADTIGL